MSQTSSDRTAPQFDAPKLASEVVAQVIRSAEAEAATLVQAAEAYALAIRRQLQEEVAQARTSAEAIGREAQERRAAILEATEQDRRARLARSEQLLERLRTAEHDVIAGLAQVRGLVDDALEACSIPTSWSVAARDPGAGEGIAPAG